MDVQIIYYSSLSILALSCGAITYLHFRKHINCYHNRHSYIICTISGYCTYNYYINVLFSTATLLMSLYILQNKIPLADWVKALSNLIFPIILTFQDNIFADIVHCASMIILIILSIIYTHYLVLSIWIMFIALYFLSILLCKNIVNKSRYNWQIGMRDKVSMFYEQYPRYVVYTKLVSYATILTEYVGFVLVAQLIFKATK